MKNNIPPYTAKGGALYINEELIAEPHQIVVDTRQTTLVDYIKATRPSDIVLYTLPYGDYAWVNAAGQVVGWEEKKLQDLVSSWRSRRLQRQLRHLAQAVALPGLGLRGLTENFSLFQNEDDREGEVWLDVLKWSLTLGAVGFLPMDDSRVLNTLRNWRSVILEGRHLLSIISGDDRGRKVQPTQLSPIAASLQRTVPRVGVELASRWAEAANQNLIRALSMTDTELLSIKGMHRGVVKELNKLTGVE